MSIKITEHNEPKQEVLKVIKSRNTVELTTKVVNWVDEETGQHMVYMKAFELTGYGKTLKDAKEMLKDSVDFFFYKIIKLDPDRIAKELKKYGWTKSKFSTKQFSKAFVDIDGDLKNFNVKKSQVKSNLVTF
jgi:hypothetical protein